MTNSNVRWVVFSSRRLDGRYTRLYLAHFDGEGHFGKPFLLPQKRYEHKVLRLKSYNVTEFVQGIPAPSIRKFPNSSADEKGVSEKIGWNFSGRYYL